MRIVSEEVRGNLTIKEDSQFNRINAEQIRVKPNVRVRLFGEVKDLIIEEGSYITVHGKVTGVVRNQGGSLNIFHYRD